MRATSSAIFAGYFEDSVLVFFQDRWDHNLSYLKSFVGSLKGEVSVNAPNFWLRWYTMNIFLLTGLKSWSSWVQPPKYLELQLLVTSMQLILNMKYIDF
jgi:hypothetical protein